MPLQAPEFKFFKRAEIRPENRSLGLVKHSLITESGTRQFSDGGFVRLEIAFDGSGFYLFHICADGTGTDSWHETLDDALHQAEFEFNVSRDDWQDISTIGV